MLNKPKGVVTTRNDPERRQTVMDLVPAVAGLFPVGRLDVTTEGLILLTNDGAFAERVAHPRYETPRVYLAKVRSVPDAATFERMRKGVMVEGDRLAVDRVRLVESDKNVVGRADAARGQAPRGAPAAGGRRPSGVEAAARVRRAGDAEGPGRRRVPLAHARRRSRAC